MHRSQRTLLLPSIQSWHVDDGGALETEGRNDSRCGSIAAGIAPDHWCGRDWRSVQSTGAPRRRSFGPGRAPVPCSESRRERMKESSLSSKLLRPSGTTSGAERNPFGEPSGKPDYSVPQPPGQATLVPAFGTKTTQRLYGDDPFQEAVSITQHIWPAERAANAPGENDNDPDRPWTLTLVTPDDPLTAITATPLIHFPDDAPILYVTKTGIPKVTLNEIKRLGDTGISRLSSSGAPQLEAAGRKGPASLRVIGPEPLQDGPCRFGHARVLDGEQTLRAPRLRTLAPAPMRERVV
jgi:hypothetical protein